ncbi:MAG: hypothetical protein H6891_06640 [Brucellaceae bacterium]|nr:hypothetical protein [Brucellaceae bacterium]
MAAPIRTYASQTIAVGDPGFLTALLVSYIGTDRDAGNYDYPTVRIGGTYYWLLPSGALSTSATSTTIDNDNSGITNLTVRTTLTPGSVLIGVGVTATDSQFGAGTAIWDNVDFQELTQSPGAQTTNEDTSRVPAGANALQVATNSGASSMTVTVSVSNGTLTLSGTAGITVTGGANGSATMTFTGSPAAINAALNGLTYAPAAEYFGSDTLTFTVAGGSLNDTDTVPITVNSVPDYAISVTKAASPPNVANAGAAIAYTIGFTNTGDTAMTGVTVTDILAQNGVNTPLAVSGPTGDGGTAGVLDIGETWSYTASHTVTQAQIDDGNDLVNTVTVGTAQMGASAGSASASTTIGTSPALAIVKSHVLTKAPGNTDPGAEPGDLIAYSYAVTNTGNLTFNNVWVSDAHNGYGAPPVPAGEALTGDGGMPGDSTDTAANDGNWAVLAPGDTVTFAANYTVVQADVDNLQ